MEYDNGEVLPGLNEPWTFAGANMIEWIVGVVVFLFIGAFSTNMARAVPLMIVGWVSTTLGLASMRSAFPDQERGLKNAFTVACGVSPLGLPAPSALRSIWSGAPVRELSPKCQFVKLGLYKIHPIWTREFKEDEDNVG